MTRTRSSALVLAVILCLAALTPLAAAAPPPQGGALATFRKPAWGLGFSYPSTWTLQTDQPAYVTFTYAAEADGAVLVVARNRAWRDPGYPLEDVFSDVLNEVSARVENSAFEPGAERTIAGAQARVATFTTTDVESGHDMTGYVLAFSAGREAYAVIAGSFVETWDAHQPEVDRVLRSLRIQPAAQPTATRTPRGKSQPTATPTEEPLPTDEPSGPEPVATEEPATTPVPHRTATPGARFITAREAYEAALPVAREWKDTAVLYEFHCYLQGDATGRCRDWTVTFAPGTTKSSEAYEIKVIDGRVDLSLTSRNPLHDRNLPPEGWIDSPEAMDTFNGQGGEGFLTRRPNATLSMALRASFSAPKYIWDIEAIDGTWQGVGASLRAEIDPVQNTIDTEPPPSTGAATHYYTLRQALGVAQKAMAAHPDARMSWMFGHVEPGEPGYDQTRCAYWTVYFSWSETVTTTSGSDVESLIYSLDVSDGQVKNADYGHYSPGPAATGDWGDSPAALKVFRGSADYATFAEAFPTHGWSFDLRGEEKLGHLWAVAAELQGLKLEERFTLPAK